MTRREFARFALYAVGASALSSCGVLEPPKPIPLDASQTQRLSEIARANPQVARAISALVQQGYQVDWAQTSGSKAYWGVDKLVALGVFTNDPNRFFVLAFKDDTLGIASLSEKNPLVIAGLIQIIKPGPDTYDFVFTDLLAKKTTLLTLDSSSHRVLSLQSGEVRGLDSLEQMSNIKPVTSTQTKCQVPESLLRSLEAAKATEALAYLKVTTAAVGVATSKLSLAGCVVPTAPVTCPTGIATVAGAVGGLALATTEARIAQIAREAVELEIQEWIRQNCR